MAAALFQYAGEEGDTNALYTYAQLLRTGPLSPTTCGLYLTTPSLGQGTETDLSQAGQLFSELAMKGHPYAQFALAGMYYTGSGVEQNFTRAYSLYSVASQNYVAEAFNVLGESVTLCVHCGVCLPLPPSLTSLTPYLSPFLPPFSGSMHQHGQGVEENMDEAIKHFTSGAELGK